MPRTLLFENLAYDSDVNIIKPTRLIEKTKAEIEKKDLDNFNKHVILLVEKRGEVSNQKIKESIKKFNNSYSKKEIVKLKQAPQSTLLSELEWKQENFYALILLDVENEMDAIRENFQFINGLHFTLFSLVRKNSSNIKATFLKGLPSSEVLNKIPEVEEKNEEKFYLEDFDINFQSNLNDEEIMSFIEKLFLKTKKHLEQTEYFENRTINFFYSVLEQFCDIHAKDYLLILYKITIKNNLQKLNRECESQINERYSDNFIENEEINFQMIKENLNMEVNNNVTSDKSFG